MDTRTLFLELVNLFSQWVIILLIFGIVAYAYFRKVRVYESFVIGAKEGFNVAIMIIPYLVAILCAIIIFRTGGAEKILTMIMQPITDLIDMPPALLPLAIVRPLSGGGARGVMLDIFQNFGPDSREGFMASVVQGSTETTFYVIAVYFGSIGVSKTRYAAPVCLFGDLVGIIAAVVITNFIFGIYG